MDRISKKQIAKKHGVSSSALKHHLNNVMYEDLKEFGYSRTQKYLTKEQYDFFMRNTTIRANILTDFIFIQVIVIFVLFCSLVVAFFYYTPYIKKSELADMMGMERHRYKYLMNQKYFHFMVLETNYNKYSRSLTYHQAKTFFEILNSGESFEQFLKDINES